MRQLVAAVGVLVCLCAGAVAQEGKPAPRALPLQMSGEWKGDFEGMVERRLIRVLVPYSRTLYFNDKGRERGITAELMRDFERYINEKYRKKLGKRRITVVIRPTTRDLLLTNVAEGLADLAAGNLTMTEERLKTVDFFAPADQKGGAEIVLTRAKAPPLASVEELSGRTVHVRKASSYYESLVALNDRLTASGSPPAKLVLVPDALEDEDMMEMLNAGLLEAIVVDRWKARIWTQVLPAIRINEAAAVRTAGLAGWAMRKDSLQLRAILEEFYARHVKKLDLIDIHLAQYLRRIRQIKDSTAADDTQRFESTLAMFRKFGSEYGFDPLMLAAQGYQESRLDQKARSPVGAIGIMQVMPQTGAEMKVGDITIAERNIHAGVKYMSRLVTRYLKGADLDETDRTLFAFACYNAGPGNVARMRKLAGKRGLDPNRWFNNVEIVTAEKIGLETTTYVRNIYKYYVAYKLAVDVQAAQKSAREGIGSNSVKRP